MVTSFTMNNEFDDEEYLARAAEAVVKADNEYDKYAEDIK